MRKPVFIAASPNTKREDVLLALSLFARPWKWRDASLIKNLELEIKKFLNVEHVHSLDSARSGIFITLKAMGVGEGDEVIVPSFTCLVLANAVRWTGATPIYLDTNEHDYNANYDSITSKTTDKTKAIIVQHTFGKMIDIEKLRSLIPNSSQPIYLIEDWAHTIYRNQPLLGDVAIMTFGIEKVVSGVRGGAIITKNKNLKTKIEQEISELPNFPISKALNALTNPIFWYVASPLHAMGIKQASIGAGIRWIWRKLGFLGNMIEKEEHKGDKPDWFPTQASPVLAAMAHMQFLKLDQMNAHRQKIAKIYHEFFSELSDYQEFDEARVWLRYPLQIKNQKNKNQILKKAQKLKIVLGDWYVVPLYSKYVTKQTYAVNCYVPETTPVTLKKCKSVLNLPTGPNISEKRARELAREINNVIM